MYRWKVAAAVIFALLLGAAAAFVWGTNGAKAKAG